MITKKTTYFVAYNVILVVAVLSLVELGTLFLLNHPKSIPTNYLSSFKDYYRLVDRKLIQTDSEFAVYHPDLFYTLKPGYFTFENREFSNEFMVNSQGFRDDEASLKAPKMIVVGDSYAMGWGVDQDSTFAQLLEQSSGQKVLNTAISSYGTAREIEVLKYLDLSNLETLIIQYCGNDIVENQQFHLKGNRLEVSSEEVYKEAVNHAASINGYYPMKHFSSLGASIFLDRKYTQYKPIESFSNEFRQGESSLSEAEMFLNILANSEEIKKVPRIILLELDYTSRSSFIEELRYTLMDSSYKSLRAKLVLMDFSEIMNAHDYYVLDEHLKASAHKKIADALQFYLNNKVQVSEELRAFHLSFEEEAPKGWNYNPSAVIQGSLQFNHRSEWGLSYSMKLDQFKDASRLKSLELVYDYKGDMDSAGLMVMSVNRDTNKLVWQGIETVKSYRDSLKDGWWQIKNRFTINEPIEFNAKDEVEFKLYYWNIKKANFNIDNVRLKMRAPTLEIYNP